MLQAPSSSIHGIYFCRHENLGEGDTTSSSPFVLPRPSAVLASQRNRVVKSASSAVAMKLNLALALIISTYCATAAGCRCVSSTGTNSEATKVCCQEAKHNMCAFDCAFSNDIGTGEDKIVFSNCCRSYGNKVDCSWLCLPITANT